MDCPPSWSQPVPHHRRSHPTRGDHANLQAFSSRVLSRSHVNLYIDTHGAVWATDLNSLHGTAVERNSRSIKLTAYEPYRLLENDTLIFGKTVTSRDGVIHAPLRVKVHYLYTSPTAAAEVGDLLRPTFAQFISEINLPRSPLRGYGIPIMYESEHEEDLPRGGVEEEDGDGVDRDSIVYLGGFSNNTTPASDRGASPENDENDITEIAAADFVHETARADDDDARPVLPNESVATLRQAVLSSLAPFVLNDLDDVDDNSDIADSVREHLSEDGHPSEDEHVSENGQDSEADEEESDEERASADEMEVDYDDFSSVGSANPFSDDDHSEEDDSSDEHSEAGDSGDGLHNDREIEAGVSGDNGDSIDLPPWRTVFTFSAPSTSSNVIDAMDDHAPATNNRSPPPTATVIPSSVPEEAAEGFFEESANVVATDDMVLPEPEVNLRSELSTSAVAVFADDEEQRDP